MSTPTTIDIYNDGLLEAPHRSPDPPRPSIEATLLMDQLHEAEVTIANLKQLLAEATGRQSIKGPEPVYEPGPLWVWDPITGVERQVLYSSAAYTYALLRESQGQVYAADCLEFVFGHLVEGPAPVDVVRARAAQWREKLAAHAL